MATFDLQRFEDHSYQNGGRYWIAHEFMLVLGYKDWKTFNRVINRAMRSCLDLGVDISEAFIQATIESEGKEVNTYRLTRFACFLVTMQADSRKPEVTEAKAVLAAIADALVEQRIQQDAIERIEERGELRDSEKEMSAIAYQSGLRNNEFGIFKDSGFRGMYNLSLNELKRYKQAKTSKNLTLYDLMGKTELAANRFRVTQTAERIKTTGAAGLSQLKQTAHDVGSEVRGIMIKSSGIAPEDLRLEEDISKVKKRIKSAGSKMKALDATPEQRRNGKGSED
uniref:DNA-damage-inducible protein D n=1 Tax=Candidatus Kentrum sp. LPFa TaxID=2126335 RepID=A0A450WRN8_9GAMM|nr:MAG: DNA-damage-inducible protein D [Candidatus Kentron sp. LPFa]VFK33941.1 MAG: DNA-damage-inducible protein D [Candidatus Kentron sp. LPFa]